MSVHSRNLFMKSAVSYHGFLEAKLLYTSNIDDFFLNLTMPLNIIFFCFFVTPFLFIFADSMIPKAKNIKYIFWSKIRSQNIPILQSFQLLHYFREIPFLLIHQCVPKVLVFLKLLEHQSCQKITIMKFFPR